MSSDDPEYQSVAQGPTPEPQPPDKPVPVSPDAFGVFLRVPPDALFSTRETFRRVLVDLYQCWEHELAKVPAELLRRRGTLNPERTRAAVARTVYDSVRAIVAGVLDQLHERKAGVLNDAPRRLAPAATADRVVGERAAPASPSETEGEE